jgi:hypothetical protein
MGLALCGTTKVRDGIRVAVAVWQCGRMAWCGKVWHGTNLAWLGYGVAPFSIRHGTSVSWQCYDTGGAGEKAVYGPHSYFSSSGGRMDHCVGEIAVYGSRSYFSFIRWPNGPLCR